MLRPTLITPADDVPISLAQAKAHLRVNFSNDDDLISALIDAATAYFDGYSGVLGRCLMQQTWQQAYESFRCSSESPASLPTKVGPTLRLPFPDVTAVVVKYYDAANAQQTVAGGSYQILADELGSFVAFPYTYVPPNTYFRADAVSVDLTAGYADADSVPADIKAAIKLMIGKLYPMAKSDALLDRESVEGIGTKTWGTAQDMAFVIDGAIAALTDRYRRIGL